MHFKLISTVNLRVDWHLTVHHSRRYANENNCWHGFTAQRDSYSFMLFNGGFRASSSFKFATFRYLQFSFSFSVFTHMACSQIKTGEIPIFPVVFKPFGSSRYQDHILIFFILLISYNLQIFLPVCSSELQRLCCIFRLNIAPKRKHEISSMAAENTVVLLVFIHTSRIAFQAHNAEERSITSNR